MKNKIIAEKLADKFIKELSDAGYTSEGMIKIFKLAKIKLGALHKRGCKIAECEALIGLK